MGVRRFVPAVAVAAAVLGFQGCAKKAQVVTRPAPPYSVYSRPHAAFTDAEQKLIDRNCPNGLPQTRRGFEFGPTQIVIRQEYVLRHASLDKISIFVCEGVSPELLQGPGDRDKSSFKADPALGNVPKAVDSDYKGLKNRFDRGHLAPAANHKDTQQAMNETHFLSNVVPQVSSMNQHIWQELENITRTWVEKYSDVYELTGGFFYDPDEEDPAKADGLVPHKTIGKGVAVPTHLYKVVVAKHPDGKRRAIAFVMENREYPRKGPFHYEPFIQSIRWIEEHAGLNFMPDLEPEAADELETKPGQLSQWK